MPFASLAFPPFLRLLPFLQWAAIWTVLAVINLSVASEAVAADTSLRLRPQINWQFLQPENLDDSDSLIASYDPLDFPFNNDFPFSNREFHLEEGESIFIKLPARHWFHLAYTDEDAFHKSNSHEDEKNGDKQKPTKPQKVQQPLTGWISDAPGLAKKSLFAEQQNILPPASRNRIIEISNPHKDTLSFLLATGESINHQTFAPLSWMHEKNGMHEEQNADEETFDEERESHQEEKNDVTRFYGSDNRDQDYLQKTHSNENQELEFTLEKDKIYWLEGVQVTGEQWSQAQSQLLTWQQDNKDSDSLSGHSQFLFARGSRKQLLTQDEEHPNKHIKAMRPGVYKADKNMNTTLLLDKQGYVRLQSTDEDWLFSSNYKDYASPAIAQKLQQADLSQQLHQHITPVSGEHQYQGTATDITRDKKLTKTIRDLSSAATLNSWLSWQNLSPQAHRGIEQQAIQSKALSWNFAGEDAPDLSPAPISLPGISQKQLFNTLSPNKSITWYRPDDAVSNQLQLQVAPLEAAKQSSSPKNAINFVVKVDGKVFAQFTRFQPPELQPFVQDPHWHLEEVSHQEKERSSAKVQAHNNAIASGSTLLNLPADWRKLEIEIPTGKAIAEEMSTESSALVRIRYRKPRYPKLDAPQWHTWLTHKNRLAQAPAAKLNSPAAKLNSPAAKLDAPEAQQLKVSPTLENHPHWLHFQHYVQVKQKQFNAQAASPFWQGLITGEGSTDVLQKNIFSLDFPEGMLDYQRLKTNLSKPQVNDWQYWQQILEDLRSGGWSGYANDLSAALVSFHPNSYIIEQASKDYFYQLSLNNNYSQQVSLLSYVIFSNKLSPDANNGMLLALANLFQQQNRHDYGLFILGFVPDSQARNQLIVNAAQHEGYLSLAEAFALQGERTSGTTKPGEAISGETISISPDNQRQQISLNSVSQISAAKRIQLYNPELNVRQRNLLATPDEPLTIKVSGPTQLEFETRLWFEHKNLHQNSYINTKNGWLTLSYDQQTQLVPLFYSDYRSNGLQHPQASVGTAHRFTVFIPNSGTLILQPENHDISVNFREVSNNLANTKVSTYCYRDNTWLVQESDRSSEFWWYSNQDADKEQEQPPSEQEDRHRHSPGHRNPFNCHFTMPGNSATLTAALAAGDASSLNMPETFSVVAAGGAFYPGNRAKYQDFLQQLKGFEKSPDNQALTVLNRRLHQWPPSSQKHRLQQRVNRDTSWQAQNNPMRVKMFSAFQANTNAPLTPAGYRSRLLYTPFNPEWEKLSESSALNYELAISDKQQYRLKLLSQQHLFLTQSSVEVEVAINGRFHDVVFLTMGQETELPLPFSTGTQNLNIRLNNAKGQVSVLAQLQYRETDSEKNKAQNPAVPLQWKTQPQKVRLKLFQAAEQQPLQQFFPEPSWLRIDSFTEKGIVKQEYMLAEKGIFSWYPEDANQQVIGHRLYHLKLLPESMIKERHQAQLPDRSTAGKAGSKTAPLALNLYPSGDSVELTPAPTSADSFPSFVLLPETPKPEEQQFVSRPWGMELGLEQRRTPAEDQAQNNRFWQLRLYSQSADPQRRFFSRYDMALRQYDSDLSPSLHASYQWWDTAWWHDWDLNVGFRLAAQEGFVDDELAWSGRANVQAIKQYSLNRRWFNRFSINLWGNLIRSGKDTQQFATAVYSQYKLDHRYGIQLSDTLRYKWHHDFESWLQFTLNSNPFSQSDLLDNGILVLGSRLFYQGLAADIRWRYQSFMADENRANKSKDSRLSLALDWFGWEDDAHYRLRLGYDRNLIADENYWFLRLNWNESGSRGVQDYMPQSLAFASLRQQEFNNEVLENATIENTESLNSEEAHTNIESHEAWENEGEL